MQTILLSSVEKMCKIGVYKGLFKNVLTKVRGGS